MKIAQQRKLANRFGALSMIVVFASTAVAWMNPDYTDYAVAGLGVFLVLMVAVAIFLFRKQAT